MIQLVGSQKFIGFKFLICWEYPRQPPIVILDEPINKQVIEFIDYIDSGNVIMF